VFHVTGRPASRNARDEFLPVPTIRDKSPRAKTKADKQELVPTGCLAANYTVPRPIP
jgi:hypothetical protein